MARYTLNTTQLAIVKSWLFETGGYLDGAVDNFGMSARTMLQIDPLLDVTLWIRTSTRNIATELAVWDQCGMVWWIWKTSGVNITPQTKPPETSSWVAVLNAWAASITEAFLHVSQAVRNGSWVLITAEDGSLTMMPSGDNLVQQQNMFDNIVAALT